MPKQVIGIEVTRKVGDIVTCYLDWQTEKNIEGVCQLIEFKGHSLPFCLKYIDFVGEKWLVRFEDGFTTHRLFKSECIKIFK